MWTLAVTSVLFSREDQKRMKTSFRNFKLSQPTQEQNSIQTDEEKTTDWKCAKSRKNTGEQGVFYLSSQTIWTIRSRASWVPELSSACPFAAWVPMRNNLRSPTWDNDRASWRSVMLQAPGRSWKHEETRFSPPLFLIHKYVTTLRLFLNCAVLWGQEACWRLLKTAWSVFLSCSPVCWPEPLKEDQSCRSGGRANVSLRGGRVVGWRSPPQTPA